ncbi:hypothetical protein F2P81_018692 [Scophthalmus maximus]|uniref:Uncharacterized protein n=1 Tax=Scophthalmus maximus TaxID=52904 RepID=A0A6A4S8V5_SCOMX|nr:hypothetical protein F2P81_018692 [Scophthalmus maximus]
MRKLITFNKTVTSAALGKEFRSGRFSREPFLGTTSHEKSEANMTLEFFRFALQCVNVVNNNYYGSAHVTPPVIVTYALHSRRLLPHQSADRVMLTLNRALCGHLSGAEDSSEGNGKSRPFRNTRSNTYHRANRKAI